MTIPQRDETIEKIKRLDTLLEYAVMHSRLRRRRQVARRSVATEPGSWRKRTSDEAEAVRRRARPRRIHGIIHSRRSPQAESRRNFCAEIGKTEE